MATTAKVIVKQKAQIINEEVKSVQLEMSMKDAHDIVALFGMIGGHPAGPRGAVNRIFNALREAGVKNNNNVAWEVTPYRSHYITYKK